MIPRKKKAPSKILRNRRRLQTFLETRNKPQASSKDKGADRDLGESTFKTPLAPIIECGGVEESAESKSGVGFQQLGSEEKHTFHTEISTEIGGAHSGNNAGGQILKDNNENKDDSEDEHMDWSEPPGNIGEKLDKLIEMLRDQTVKLMDSKHLDNAIEASQGILTPERDKRTGMRGEKEKSQTDWSYEVAPEEGGQSVPWDSTPCSAEAELSQKTMVLPGRRKRGRPKKQKEDYKES